MKSRRSFLKETVALTAASALGVGPAIGSQLSPGSTGDLPSLKGRKVLFTYGGWPGHEPAKWRDYLTHWLKENGASVVSSAVLKPYADADFMSTIDLVIQIHTISEITNEEEKGLLNAIKSGTGLAGWHGGMCDAFRSNVDYQFMTGGQFVAHPGGSVDFSVQMSKAKDPIIDGLSEFKMISEQYYMHVDPNVKVLATTTFNDQNNDWIGGCVMPVVWKKMHGKGRIFYSSLGHKLSHVTDVPNAIEITKRGIKWASASKYEPAEKWISPIYKTK